MSSPFKGSNASGSSSKGGSRGRSGSDATAQGFNQRLWGYLFRNVNRCVGVKRFFVVLVLVAL